eukprot:7811087-Alexandrium_andersonii.AAC.1
MALSVFTHARQLAQDSGPGRQVIVYLRAEQTSELRGAPAIRLCAEPYGVQECIVRDDTVGGGGVRSRAMAAEALVLNCSACALFALKSIQLA